MVIRDNNKGSFCEEHGLSFRWIKVNKSFFGPVRQMMKIIINLCSMSSRKRFVADKKPRKILCIIHKIIGIYYKKQGSSK